MILGKILCAHALGVAFFSQNSLLSNAALILSTITTVQYGLLAHKDDLMGLMMPNTLPGDE